MKLRIKARNRDKGQSYLTREPLPPHITTPITDANGNTIAEWVSTNLRQPFDEVEVEEAVRWAAGKDKWIEMRKGQNGISD